MRNLAAEHPVPPLGLPAGRTKLAGGVVLARLGMHNSGFRFQPKHQRKPKHNLLQGGQRMDCRSQNLSLESGKSKTGLGLALAPA